MYVADIEQYNINADSSFLQPDDLSYNIHSLFVILWSPAYPMRKIQLLNGQLLPDVDQLFCYCVFLFVVGQAVYGMFTVCYL